MSENKVTKCNKEPSVDGIGLIGLTGKKLKERREQKEAMELSNALIVHFKKFEFQTLVTTEKRFGQQTLQTMANDVPNIVKEIEKLSKEDLKEKSDRELIRKFRDGFHYDGEDIRKNYQDSHYLRAKGIPIFTDTKKKTYKMAEDENEHIDCNLIEKKRADRKEARHVHMQALNPERLEKLIKAKTRLTELIETKTEVKEDENEDK